MMLAAYEVILAIYVQMQLQLPLLPGWSQTYN